MARKKIVPVEEPSVEDFVVQIYGLEDEKDILGRDTFDVNMRLFRLNKYYRCMVDHAVRLLSFVLLQTFNDHPNLSSLSGPKCGIPWSIIVYRPSNSVKTTVMINPVIIRHSPVSVAVKTRCACCSAGKEDRQVLRWQWIDVKYYDEHGGKQTIRSLTKSEGGYAIQHELCHLQGIIPGTTLLPTVRIEAEVEAVV